MKLLFNILFLGLTASLIAQIPAAYTQFVANNMMGGTPMDNDMAISNAGYILSVDNTAYDYYESDGTQIRRDADSVFYKDRGTPSIIVGQNTFDPRCLYDRESDRFIIVTLTKDTNNTRSRLLISFSKTNRPDGMYWHYEFPVSHFYPTTPTTYWLDYPNIAVNKNELFISLNTFNPSRVFVNNLIVQIDKRDGYNGIPLDKRSFTDIRDVNNTLIGNIVPVGEARQDTLYNDTMYFIRTSADTTTFNDTYYWWQLNSTLNDAPSGLIKKSTPAGFSYKPTGLIPQPGGISTDKIKALDCRIVGAYFQNNRIVFCYHRRGSTGDAINTLARINVLNNSMVYNDLTADHSTNLCYPSIATYSYNPTEYKTLMAYQKVGKDSADFVSLWVVALDENRVWSTKQQIQEGFGIVDINPGETERLGDYIKIQPKYDALNGECWMVGSYAAGSSPNDRGVRNGYNAYIAQIRMYYTHSVEELQNKTLTSYLIYPNPTTTILNVQSKTGLETSFDYSIFDLTGKLILQGTSTSQIDVNELQNGFYHLRLKTDKHGLETYKIIKY